MKRHFISCILMYLIFISCTHAQPGKKFRDCADCPEMVVVPGGDFLMGVPENETGTDWIEGPQRKIHIHSFAVGKFDITRGEWRAFVTATQRPTHGGCSWTALPLDSTLKPWDPNPAASWTNLGFEQNDTHPVVCITWFDAVDYIKWLNKKTGGHYRLLSESEWEYADRAGTTTPFYWGATASHSKANYGKDTCCAGLISGEDKWFYTSPVGSFPPNAFGLYDMNGNVLQYIQDYLGVYGSGLPDNGSAYETKIVLQLPESLKDYNGQSSSAFRIVRGGDWGDPPFMLRSGYRNWAPGPGSTLENYSSSGVGFRVAKTLQ